MQQKRLATWCFTDSCMSCVTVLQGHSVIQRENFLTVCTVPIGCRGLTLCPLSLSDLYPVLTVWCLTFHVKRKEPFPDPYSYWLFWCMDPSLQVTNGTSPMKNLVMDHVLVCHKPPIFSREVTRSSGGAQETSPWKGLKRRVL